MKLILGAVLGLASVLNVDLDPVQAILGSGKVAESLAEGIGAAGLQVSGLEGAGFLELVQGFEELGRVLEPVFDAGHVLL